MERFQHSSETISRYFSVGLTSLVSLAQAIIKPEDPTFVRMPAQIRNDARYMPHFKGCIGAIDGTHVHARVPENEKVAFIGRSGSTTQNIMAVCDFNMCFTFAMAGWEGSAHDSRIFKIATRNPKYNRGYLKPYPDTRYHLPDFQRASNRTRNRKEVFNRRHSSLRGVIERTFGVWKKKWVILRDMPPYPFPKQVQVVLATMALTNYIRRHPTRADVDFERVEVNDDEVPVEAYEYRIGQSLPTEENDNASICTKDGEGASEMKALREEITASLVGD
ncbi:putative nuclease HARBI1 [Phalaenopsis equestris]|uniref:putative nuclease HARBI1 n=1 Tax=Phalaenopsis equestris TaxID=78828 RepID=UPI0009E38B34|nr:putative nuclease HARBI1 [Phalaenopsis equestris]